MKKQLSNQEMRLINEQIKTAYQLDFFSKKDHAELHDNKIIVRNNEPIFFIINNKLYPTLHLLLKNNFLKTVTIDMQAVKFIVSGADIMRPGIVAFDDFKEQDVVCVIDQKNKKPLAVGIALVASAQMNTLEKGKTVKNIHYVSDPIWTYGTGPA